MPGVRVLTDSAACLPQELAEAHRVGIVPLSVAFGGRAYMDGIDITLGEFYEVLTDGDVVATTSAPSPLAYLEAYSAAATDAGGILCVTLSSRVSHAYDSARQATELARQALPDVPIRVLDLALGGPSTPRWFTPPYPKRHSPFATRLPAVFVVSNSTSWSSRR